MLIVGHQNYCDIVQPSEKLQKKKEKKRREYFRMQHTWVATKGKYIILKVHNYAV